MQVLLYVNDYLLGRHLSRRLGRMSGVVVTYHQLLPVAERLPPAGTLDALVLHHCPRFGASRRTYDNLYLTECVYPGLPVVVISGEEAAAVRRAFRWRPGLTLAGPLPGRDQLHQSLHAATHAAKPYGRPPQHAPARNRKTSGPDRNFPDPKA